MEMRRRYRREVRVLDVPFWGRTTSMFVQVFMNREPTSDSDLFKVMIRFKKKTENATDESILKFNMNELMTIYTFLNGGDLPKEFIDEKTGGLVLVHPDPETGKKRKVIRFLIDDGREDPSKRGTLLITVADYTSVLKREAKKPTTIHKRLIVSEVEIFKKIVGNLLEIIMQSTIYFHMFNKYYKWVIRDIVQGKKKTVTQEQVEEQEEEEEGEEEELDEELDEDFFDDETLLE